MAVCLRLPCLALQIPLFLSMDRDLGSAHTPAHPPGQLHPGDSRFPGRSAEYESREGTGSQEDPRTAPGGGPGEAQVHCPCGTLPVGASGQGTSGSGPPLTDSRNGSGTAPDRIRTGSGGTVGLLRPVSASRRGRYPHPGQPGCPLPCSGRERENPAGRDLPQTASSRDFRS